MKPGCGACQGELVATLMGAPRGAPTASGFVMGIAEALERSAEEVLADMCEHHRQAVAIGRSGIREEKELMGKLEPGKAAS